MFRRPRVTWIQVEGWEGLYINGVLVREDVMIRMRDIPQHKPIVFEAIYASSTKLNQRVIDKGTFPATLRAARVEYNKPWFLKEDNR